MPKLCFVNSQFRREWSPVSQGFPHPLFVLVDRCLFSVERFAVDILLPQAHLPPQGHFVGVSKGRSVRRRSLCHYVGDGESEY